MTIRSAALLLAVALLAASCGSSDANDSAVISTASPELAPGTVSGGSVEVDGITIDYVVSTPEGFVTGDEAPLLLAFPAGGQDLALTRSLVEGTYAPEAQRLGWVVVRPDRVLSLTTFPGFPRSENDQAALAQLVDVPVRLYVGGTDIGWVGPAEQAANTLEALGGDVEVTIFEGEGHVMDSTSDGVLVFEQFESFR